MDVVLRERGRHPSEANSAEVKGVVTSSPTGSCPDSLSFDVEGYRVTTDGNTVFTSGTCADIAEGVRVKVVGLLLTDATPPEILAAEVTIDLDDDEDGEEGEEGAEKVEICHVTGKGDRSHTIEVSVNAMPAHLKHGDSLGACD